MHRLLPLLTLSLLTASSAAAAGVLDWLFPKRDVQVIVVTDTTPVGALRRAVTAEKPAYYMAVSAGFREFGGSIAGEKPPPKEEVLKTVSKVLAKQGYLPSNDENPPTVILFWTWGTMNTDRMYSASPDDTQGYQVNQRQLMRFMGAYKLGLISKEPNALRDEYTPGVLFRDADQELIANLATEDLYVAAISAYDYAAATRKEKVLLWTTKISCPSQGLMMKDSLPVMLALSGPHIGRETAKPVSIKATDKFKPEVKIGDPIMVEYLDNTQVKVIEVTPPNGPKDKKAPAPTDKKR
jgi:hypothetical protein